MTIYQVRCRKKLDKAVAAGMPPLMANSRMLVKAVKRNMHHPELDRILEEYCRPVMLSDKLCGDFVLERRFNWFSGKPDWLGENCSVTLGCDKEDGKTANQSLAAFHKVYGSLKEWDEKLRSFADRELTELANDWLEDEESEPISESAFADRISISEFTVEANGDFTAYYYDDDMFWGHVVVIGGNVDTGPDRADIAG